MNRHGTLAAVVPPHLDAIEHDRAAVGAMFDGLAP
jgi:hypothetical protein